MLRGYLCRDPYKSGEGRHSPHQLEAVGNDDAEIDPEEEDPTEVFTKGEDGEMGGP